VSFHPEIPIKASKSFWKQQQQQQEQGHYKKFLVFKTQLFHWRVKTLVP
jgi:hypothetical protein